MEQKKIYIVLAYPNKYKNGIARSVEICKKFPWIDFFCLPPGEPYEKLREVPNKELYEVAILPNERSGILENILPFFPNLKLVQAASTGIDKLLECPNFVSNKDIILTNLKSVSNVLLSEFAIFGCLFFAKRTRYFLDLMEKKEWTPKEYFGTDCLDKKTALIVGSGSIGTAIAKKCKYGFNMKVYGIKRDISTSDSSIDKVFEMKDLKTIISEADLVFNCLPTIKGIGKIYTEDIFKAMKKTSVFINVARGVAVDEEALCKALRENWITGAALDVCEKEPLDKDHMFYKDPLVKEKIFFSCHSMYKGPQYEEAMCCMIEENIINFKEGKPLNGIINKELGY